MIRKRDCAIDCLRVIGLIGIIIAHVGSPTFLMNLRSFDVPLMVIISGYLFNQGKLKTQISTWRYVKQRFIRLVMPTWIFLIFFFCFYILYLHHLPPLQQVVSSFLLYDGIGYVWIIRIFFVVAIFGTPFTKFLKGLSKPYFALIGFYLLYEVSYFFIKQHSFIGKEYFINIVYYSIGYILFFAYGAFYIQFSNKQKLSILLASLLLIVGIEFIDFYRCGSFSNIFAYKYPPHLLYAFYAIFCSTLLFHLSKYMKDRRSSLISFIGSSTMWIYLWHILFIYYIPIDCYISRFFAVLLLSMIVTYLQQKAILYIINNYNISDNSKKMLKIIFLG